MITLKPLLLGVSLLSLTLVPVTSSLCGAQAPDKGYNIPLAILKTILGAAAYGYGTAKAAEAIGEAIKQLPCKPKTKEGKETLKKIGSTVGVGFMSIVGFYLFSKIKSTDEVDHFLWGKAPETNDDKK